MSRISETEGDIVKDRMVAIPDSVHNQVREISERLDQPLYESYTEALRLWLKQKGVAANIHGIGEVTADEERTILNLLELFKRKKEKQIYADTLSAVKLLMRQVITD